MPITSVGGTDNVAAGQTGVVIAGSGFGATQGAGRVDLISGGTVQAQTVTAWGGDTSVTITIVPGPFNNGKIQLRLTPNAGGPMTRDVSLAGVAKKLARQAGRVMVR